MSKNLMHGFSEQDFEVVMDQKLNEPTFKKSKYFFFIYNV